jgi:hypothetical protein
MQPDLKDLYLFRSNSSPALLGRRPPSCEESGVNLEFVDNATGEMSEFRTKTMTGMTPALRRTSTFLRK